MKPAPLQRCLWRGLVPGVRQGRRHQEAAGRGQRALLAQRYVGDRTDAQADLGHTYQTVDKALEAFSNGGLFGTGPGSGTVKMSIPDAHADFVFAVAGEELGFIGALAILSLFAFIILRGIWRMRSENNCSPFWPQAAFWCPWASDGDQFGLHAPHDPRQGHDFAVHFLWRSSLVAISLQMGMFLALTRKRYGLSET